MTDPSMQAYSAYDDNPMISMTTQVALGSAHRNRILVLGSDARVTLAQSGGAMGLCGVLVVPTNAAKNVSADRPAAVSVQNRGVCPIISGEPITAGQMLTSDGSGAAIVCASGSWSVGEARTTTGAVGEWCSVLLRIPSIRLDY